MKKGFTLIELLAVIVILAIIALIATPIVLNIISDTKTNASKRSIENYMDAVELSVAKENLTRTFSPNVCQIQENGNLICDDNATEVEINIDGQAPTTGTIIFQKGSVVSYRNLMFEGKYLSKGKNDIQISDKYRPVCEAVTDDTKTVGNVPSGNGEYNYGDEYICEVGPENYIRFFVASITYTDSTNTEIETVNLIMNANITKEGEAFTEATGYGDQITWISRDDFLKAGGTPERWDYDYNESYIYDEETNSYRYGEGNTSKGPITALNFLNNATSSWVYIPNIDREYIDGSSSKLYKIQLTGKARMINYSELTNLGCTDVNDSSFFYCPSPVLLANSGEDMQRYYWIMDSACDVYASFFGYKEGEQVQFQYDGITTTAGVRPVIELPISYFN